MPACPHAQSVLLLLPAACTPSCTLHALQASLALWPNKDFCDKRTKFGIDVLSLEALLDYSEDDVKECHFEVSLFAEMFKEMLQTRFARGLMRGVAVIEQEVGTARLICKDPLAHRPHSRTHPLICKHLLAHRPHLCTDPRTCTDSTMHRSTDAQTH